MLEDNKMREHFGDNLSLNLVATGLSDKSFALISPLSLNVNFSSILSKIEKLNIYPREMDILRDWRNYTL